MNRSGETSEQADGPNIAPETGDGVSGAQIVGVPHAQAVRITWAIASTLLSFSACMAVLPPALVRITPEMNLTIGQVGTLSAFMFLPIMTMVALGGYLSRTIAKGSLNTTGCWIMAASCFFLTMADSYPRLAIGIALLGGGGGLVQVTASALIGELFEGNKRRAAMNYAHVAFAAGAIGVPFGMAVLLGSGGNWQSGFLMVGIIATIGALWMHKVGAVGLGITSRSGGGGLGVDVFTGFLVVAMFCYVAAEVGISYWLPTYFRSELRAGESFAAASNGVFWSGVIVGRLLAGILASRIRDASLLRISSAGGVIALLAFVMLDSPVSGMAVTGFAGLTFAAIWPTIMSYAGHIYGKRLTYVYPWIIGAGSFGATAGPIIMGAVASALGQQAAFLILPVFFGMIVLIVSIAPSLEHKAEIARESL